MAARDRDDDDDIVIEHPNRKKAGAKITRLCVLLLLLGSAGLIVVISIGGWERTAGAKLVQVAYVLLYLVLAIMVLRWSRGVLPLASALAIILAIFAGVSAPGWYDRAQDGYAATTLDPSFLGMLCIVLVIVQAVLILFAMRGFQQAWNVEVEHRREGRDEDRSSGRGRGGTGAVAAT